MDTPPGVGGWVQELTELRDFSPEFAELVEISLENLGESLVRSPLEIAFRSNISVEKLKKNPPAAS